MDINYIAIGISSFLLGIITSWLFFRRKNNDLGLYTILNDFKKSIDEYKNQTIINTKEINLAIKTASDITKVLTTNQNIKGQFGEECLELILQTCYPTENINYIKQFKTLNDDQKEIKPDFLIKLPNEKSILIDCKLNLEKYIEYQEAKENNLKEINKSNFIKDLNTTINNLANKKYEKAQDLNQPDFILMYIPLEPIVTAIYTDKDFISIVKNATEKNIIIVGNSSVLTTIKLTKLLWAQDKQEKNIEKIVTIAQNIYDYISLHSQNLFELKNTMEQNYQNFQKEYEKITKNNKIFKLTQELKNYGIQSSIKRNGKKINEIAIHNDFLE